MAIDVQGNTLFMQVFGYEKDGEATFYTATGQLQGNTVTAPLKRYQGGRSFGSPPKDAVENGSPGDVTLRFTHGLDGTVQFPGEPERAISRFSMRSAEYKSRYWGKRKIRSFLVAPVDPTYQTNFLAELGIFGHSGTGKGGWEMSLSRRDGRIWNRLSCEETADSDEFSCHRLADPGTNELSEVSAVRLKIANIDAYGTIDLESNGVVRRFPLQGIALVGARKPRLRAADLPKMSM
ncbi:hypothetical protein [Diaphorobacter aerolatus]|uniref:Uncharacterized protein n=1 Tax=Diaphorobacter aerolatus TaxID=1288495 RepID=A0A7H0GG25_9BURK|nr:hypothetical protein [Diaphorobacter aerolatus]QNP47241.1 hypothetical protein H9K75_12705 [Diaphorobacter aerolatus]